MLKRVGEALRQHAEPGDFVARIGGDEFALLTSLPAGQIVALAARVNRSLDPDGCSVTFAATFRFMGVGDLPLIRLNDCVSNLGDGSIRE